VLCSKLRCDGGECVARGRVQHGSSVSRSSTRLSGEDRAHVPEQGSSPCRRKRRRLPPRRPAPPAPRTRRRHESRRPWRPSGGGVCGGLVQEPNRKSKTRAAGSWRLRLELFSVRRSRNEQETSVMCKWRSEKGRENKKTRGFIVTTKVPAPDERQLPGVGCRSKSRHRPTPRKRSEKRVARKLYERTRVEQPVCYHQTPLPLTRGHNSRILEQKYRFSVPLMKQNRQKTT